MKAILSRFVIAILLIFAVFAIAIHSNNAGKVDEISGRLLVAANEARHGDESAQTRYDELAKELVSAAGGREAWPLAMWMSAGLCAAFALYLYVVVLRPFHRLETFAQRVASGDYDAPLDMPRHNVFGAFSWAFDSMRESLGDARRAEQEAGKKNKLLIATISHDIKTPIASIRACAEGLTSGQADSEERKRRYLDTIIRKSDEVTRLTNDLFLHAISEMDKLVIELVPLSLRAFVSDVSASMEIRTLESVPDVSVFADERRLGEVFGNIVRNAEKYAPAAPVTLSFSQEDDLLYCIFSDNGASLPPEDVPFIFDKFYRGQNAASGDGSGLGLYIVRYIAEKMGGDAFAQRTEDGLKIFVGLKLIP